MVHVNEETKMITDNHTHKDRRGPKRKRFLQEGTKNYKK